MSILQTLKNVISPSSSREKRVSVIGTRTAGKTTALGCLYLTCQIMSAMEPGFLYKVEEKTSGIREAPSMLRRGRFPTATLPGQYYEADFIMRWKGWGDETARLPFCEAAGEDEQKLLEPFQGGMYNINTDFRQIDSINKYILESNAFIFVAATNRVTQLEETQWYEKEPDQTFVDPDVNLARFIDKIFKYKEITRSAPIEGIAVLLTKYDEIRHLAKASGMSLETPQGARAFLDVNFPDTTASLKFYGLEKVKFFPVWVDTEKDENHRTIKDAQGNAKIVMDMRRRLPSYSIDSYKDLIQYIKTVITK